MTKALVLREHKQFDYFTQKVKLYIYINPFYWVFIFNKIWLLFKLIDWLDDSSLCKTTSGAFGLIISDNLNECPVMTHRTAANIRLFYKQRFFTFVIEPLQQRFSSTTTSQEQADVRKGNFNNMISIFNSLNASITFIFLLRTTNVLRNGCSKHDLTLTKRNPTKTSQIGEKMFII